MTENCSIDHIKEDILKLCQLRRDELDPARIRQMEKKISLKLKIWWDRQNRDNQVNMVV